MAKGQAERLLPLLEEILAEAGTTWAELTAIGVGTGPGNFTGVRISVAAARGLSLALGIPAVGVTVFDAQAYGLPRPLAVAQDARREEVYLQIFDGSGHRPQVLPVAEARAQLAPLARLQGLAVIGSAAEALGQPTRLRQAVPLVEAIARIACDRAATEQPRPAPFYLRGADAAPSSDLPPVILDA